MCPLNISKKIFILTVFCTLLYPALSFCDESNANKRERLRPNVEGFVKDLVINSLRKQVGEIIQRALQQGNIGIFPQIAYSAVQEATYQTLQQESTLKIVQDIYHENSNEALDKFVQGTDPNQIQDETKNKVERSLQPLVNNPVFQKVIELVLQNAMHQQQVITMQASRQQALQQLAIRQKVMEGMIQQRYQEAVARAYYQAAVQQQYQTEMTKEIMARQYQAAAQQQILKQRYEEMMRQVYEAAAKQQYINALSGRQQSPQRPTQSVIIHDNPQ